MSDGVITRVQDLFSSVLNVECPPSDSDLIDGGYLDSLALIELLAAIEAEFAIEIPFEEIELDRVRTIERLADLVSERVALEATNAA